MKIPGVAERARNFLRPVAAFVVNAGLLGQSQRGDHENRRYEFVKLIQ
jgi:hypothetical protein